MKSTNGAFRVAIASLVLVASAQAEDGYIESLGQQTVNLRAYKKPNTRIWIDFKPSTTEANCFYFGVGVRAGQTGPWLAGYSDSNGNFYVKYGDAGGDFVKLAPLDTERHTLSIALNEDGSGRNRIVFTTNGEEVKNVIDAVANTAMNTSSPIMLFGFGMDNKNGEYVDCTTPMKVYGVKIWEGTALVHDYVPRKVEGKFYLKDLVDGKYVTGVARMNGSATTEELTGGGDIVEEPGDAYIESHRHEYIDLGITADGTTRAELDHQLTDIDNEGYLFGSRAKASHLTFWAYHSNAGARLAYGCSDDTPSWDYFSTDGKFGIVPACLRRTFVLDALLGKASYETAGYVCAESDIATAHTQETQTPLYLFGVVSKIQNWQLLTAMKFYGLNIFKNGALVKSFTPCIKAALPGVVDQDGNFLTSGEDAVFCTNQMFAVGGAIVGDAGMDDVYLETTGNEIVDSGWEPTSNGKVIIDFAQVDPGANDGGFLFGARSDSQDSFMSVGMNRWRMMAETGGSSWQQWIGGSHTTAEQKISNGETLLNKGRYQLTLDIQNSVATLVQGGRIVAKAEGLDTGSLPPRTLAIMGLHHRSTYVLGSKIRLYSFKVYEGDTLVRSFYPKMIYDGNNWVKGLYDSCLARGTAPTQTAGLKLCGRTIDGADQGFAETPPSEISLGKDASVTLTASAPYATSYVWRRNGVVIAGATGSSCTVQPGGRGTVTYSVAPVYTVNRIVGSEDSQVEGAAATTEVTFFNGMCVKIR